MKLNRIASFLIITCFCLIAISMYAQKEGDTWVIGYYSGGSPEYSIMHMDFKSGELKLNWHFDEVMHMRETASNICDSDGNALLWTNGMEIFGKEGVYIADTIAYAPGALGYWDWYVAEGIGPIGFPIHDGAIILPIPNTVNEYQVLYHRYSSVAEFEIGVDTYLKAKVKFNEDKTFSIAYKDSVFASENYYSGTISATKHANGRQWWILIMDASGINYYLYLLDSDGLKLSHVGELTKTMEEGLGQARFSSKGNYYARMDGIDFNFGQYISLFSFNRCSGALEFINQFNTKAGFFTGVSFSPSERYLYADDNNHLWQWDLWSSDIPASQTLVDTFDGFEQPGWGPMRFGPMMNGPDGRIYIVPPAGSSEFIHVIDRPDEPAADCVFLQHHIDLKVPNGRSAPNLPNYRLGPIDGSPCDTLGINNVPQAWWRFEDQFPGWPLEIRLTDLSFFEPETWHWDFGDGQTSDERHPRHIYEPGFYHACLTVSNAYGQDSMCRWINVLPVSIGDITPEIPDDLSIAPNPFSDQLEVRSKRGDIRSVSMTIHDMHGKEVLFAPNAPVPVVLHVPHWPPGMYLVTIRDTDGVMYQFKAMKGD